MRTKLRLIGRKTVSESRDQKGRFADGNTGGPGRPRRQIETEYLKTLMDRCSLDEWDEIVKKAVADARAGNARAREWLGRYLVGNPDVKAPSPFRVVVDEGAGHDAAGEQIARNKVFNSIFSGKHG